MSCLAFFPMYVANFMAYTWHSVYSVTCFWKDFPVSIWSRYSLAGPGWLLAHGYLFDA